jgi:hypothetical protein
MSKEVHLLNLGAGVQSTTIYLKMIDGDIPPVDMAIFADTQDEPQAVYKHLEWLMQQDGPPILVKTRGRISDDLLRGETSTGASRPWVASVPFFTKNSDGEMGMTRRQCSNYYKSGVIELAIRRDLLGLKPRERVPKGTMIHQYFGISLDEAGRAVRIKARVEDHKYFRTHFPLLEPPNGMTRGECHRYLENRVPHVVPKSSCVFCPYHDDALWLDLKKNHPEDFARAVEVDESLRVPGNVVNRNYSSPMFAHRSCTPLRDVEFKNERQFNMFTGECEGMCGV